MGEHHLPAEESGAPGQAGTESAKQEEVAFADGTTRDKVVESERDAGGGGIADAIDLDGDAVWVELHIIGDGLEDASIGLMQDELGDLFERSIGVVENIADGIFDGSDGPLENGAAIHMQELGTLFDEFRREGSATTTSGDAEGIASTSFCAEGVGEETIWLVWIVEGWVGGDDEYSPCSITEEGIGFGVLGVHAMGHDFAADDERFLGHA